MDIDTKYVEAALECVEDSHDYIQKALSNVQDASSSLNSRLRGRVRGFDGAINSLEKALTATVSIISKCDTYIQSTEQTVKDLKELSSEFILNLGMGPLNKDIFDNPEKIEEEIAEKRFKKEQEKAKKELKDNLKAWGYTETDIDRLIKSAEEGKDLPEELKKLDKEIFEEYCNGDEERFKAQTEAKYLQSAHFSREESEKRKEEIERTIGKLEKNNEAVKEEAELYKEAVKKAYYDSKKGVYVYLDKKRKFHEFDVQSFEELKEMQIKADVSFEASNTATNADVTTLKTELETIEKNLSDPNKKDFTYGSVEEIDKRLKEIDKALSKEKDKALIQERDELLKIKGSIGYVVENGKYVLQDDFEEKKNFDASKAKEATYHKNSWSLFGENFSFMDSEEYRGALLARMLNGDAKIIPDFQGNSLNVCGEDGQEFYFNGNERQLELNEYQTWINQSNGVGENDPVVIQPYEVDIFNYICNRDGYDKAFEYLKGKEKEYDVRSTYIKNAEDAKLARENPWLGAASIFTAVPEAILNTGKIITRKAAGEELHSSDTYSSSNVWNSTISGDLHHQSAVLGYAYDTLYAADKILFSAVLSHGTGVGKVGTTAINAGLHGAPTFVNTVGAAKAKDMDDLSAIRYALFCAGARTLATSYVVTKATGLESTFDKMLNSGKVTSTINNIVNGSPILSKAPNLAKNVLLTEYCMATQGVTSMATAEVDSAITKIADTVMNGDKSDINIKYRNYKALHEDATDFDAYAYIAGDELSQQFSTGLVAYLSGSLIGTVKADAYISHQKNLSQTVNFKEAFETIKNPQDGYATNNNPNGGPSGGYSNGNPSGGPSGEYTKSSPSSGPSGGTSNTEDSDSRITLPTPHGPKEYDMSDQNKFLDESLHDMRPEDRILLIDKILENADELQLGEEILNNLAEWRDEAVSMRSAEITQMARMKYATAPVMNFSESSGGGYVERHVEMAIGENGEVVQNYVEVWVPDSTGENISSLQQQPPPRNQPAIADSYDVKAPVQLPSQNQPAITDSYGVKVPVEGLIDGKVIDTYAIISEKGGDTLILPFAPKFSTDPPAEISTVDWAKATGSFTPKQIDVLSKLEQIGDRTAKNGNKMTLDDLEYAYEHAGLPLNLKDRLIRQFEKDGLIAKTGSSKENPAPDSIISPDSEKLNNIDVSKESKSPQNQGSITEPFYEELIDVKDKTNLRKARGRYRILGDQFGEQIVNEAIQEVKAEKGQQNLSDMEVYLAYEGEIKNKVWSKDAQISSTPIKEIESGDVEGLVKKYNTTPEVAQTIIDLKITDSNAAASLANTILKYGLKGDPNAVELSRIINDNALSGNPNAISLADAILRFNIKDNPDAKKISQFIVDNNLKDNPNALKIYETATNGELKNNPDAVTIANMVYSYGISPEVANEVNQYDNNQFKLKQTDEKYVFNKLRQLYQAKMKAGQEINIQEETDRIMRTIGIDSDKARVLLISCMGNNWGRNSSVYWDYEHFKEDFANGEREYTDAELAAIMGYVKTPSINKYARGFQIRDGKTYYNDGTFSPEISQEEIAMITNDYYLELYNALNKYSLPKDVVVFRGASLKSLNKYGVNIDDSEEEIKKKLDGNYQDGGFMSTSAVVEKEGSHLGNVVNFVIDLKSGTPCGELSNTTFYDEECEVLIPPNVNFKVNDVKKLDGKIVIYLTSIPTKSSVKIDTKEESGVSPDVTFIKQYSGTDADVSVSKNADGSYTFDDGWDTTTISPSVMEKHLENIKGLDDSSISNYVQALRINPVLIENPPVNSDIYSDKNYKFINSNFGNNVSKDSSTGNYTIGSTNVSVEQMNNFINAVNSINDSEVADKLLEYAKGNPSVINSKNFAPSENGSQSIVDVINKVKSLRQDKVLKIMLDKGYDITKIFNQDILDNMSINDINRVTVALTSEGFIPSKLSNTIVSLAEQKNGSLLHDMLDYEEYLINTKSDHMVSDNSTFTDLDLKKKSIFDIESFSPKLKSNILIYRLLNDEISKGVEYVDAPTDELDVQDRYDAYRVSITNMIKYVNDNISIFEGEFQKENDKNLGVLDLIANIHSQNDVDMVIKSLEDDGYIKCYRSVLSNIYQRIQEDYETKLKESFDKIIETAPYEIIDGVKVYDVTPELNYMLYVHRIAALNNHPSEAIPKILYNDITMWDKIPGGNPNMCGTIISPGHVGTYNESEQLFDYSLGFANIKGHSITHSKASDAGTNMTASRGIPNMSFFSPDIHEPISSLTDPNNHYGMYGYKYNEVTTARRDVNGNAIIPNFLQCFDVVSKKMIEDAKIIGNEWYNGEPIPIFRVRKQDDYEPISNLEVIDVSKTDTERQNKSLLARGVDPNIMNMSYASYNTVYKATSNVESAINKIIKDNKDGKILLELNDTIGLTQENLSKLPSNVEIRILGDYGLENFKGFKGNDSALHTLENATYSIEECKKIMKVINDFESGINEEWNDVSKSKYAYDFLNDRFAYTAETVDNYGNRAGNSNRAKCYDGLMNLVDRISTCQGFAHTYRELLTRMGIKCYEISGCIVGGHSQHAFNVVTLNGKNVIVDTVRSRFADDYIRQLSNPNLSDIQRQELELKIKRLNEKNSDSGFVVQKIDDYVFISNSDLAPTITTLQLDDELKAYEENGINSFKNRMGDEIKEVTLNDDETFTVKTKYDEIMVVTLAGLYSQNLEQEILDMNKEHEEDLENNEFNKPVDQVSLNKVYERVEKNIQDPINREIAKKYFSLAPSMGVLNVLSEIIFEASYNGHGFYSGLCNENDTFFDSRVFSMANLYLTHPETFEFLANNDINLFHGTNSINLDSIINEGIMSAKKQIDMGKSVMTGEESILHSRQSDYISFTDVLNIAQSYVHPNDNESFGVIIGTTSADILSVLHRNISSDLPEIGVRSEFPSEKIKTILVPESKVDIVKKMVGDKDIMVLPINDSYESLFYFNDGINPFNKGYDTVKEIVDNTNYDISVKTNDVDSFKRIMGDAIKDVKSNDDGTFTIKTKYGEEISVTRKGIYSQNLEQEILDLNERHEALLVNDWLLNHVDNIDSLVNEDPDRQQQINRYISKVAKTLGTDVETFKKVYAETFKRIINDSEIGMRVSNESLSKILDSGEIKNNHLVESDRLDNSETRAQHEEYLFGIPKELAGRDSAIYGMVFPKYDENDINSVKFYKIGPGSWYGHGENNLLTEAVVVFKKDSILDYTTFTNQDSLEHGRNPALGRFGGIQAPTNANNPVQTNSWYSVDGVDSIDDLANATLYNFSPIDDHDTTGYIEAQINGRYSHTIDNIDHVVFLEPPSEEIIEKLKELGIKYTISNAKISGYDVVIESKDTNNASNDNNSSMIDVSTKLKEKPNVNPDYDLRYSITSGELIIKDKSGKTVDVLPNMLSLDKSEISDFLLSNGVVKGLTPTQIALGNPMNKSSSLLSDTDIKNIIKTMKSLDLSTIDQNVIDKYTTSNGFDYMGLLDYALSNTEITSKDIEIFKELESVQRVINNPQEALPAINKALLDIQTAVEEKGIDYLKQTDFGWLSFVIRYASRDSKYRVANKDMLIDIIHKIDLLSSKTIKTNEFNKVYKGINIKTYGNNTEFLGNALAKVLTVIDELPSALLHQVKNLSCIEIYDEGSPNNLSALFGFDKLIEDSNVEYFDTGAVYRYKSNMVQIFRPTLMDDSLTNIYEIISHELGHSLDSFMITAVGTEFTEKTDLWVKAIASDNNTISAYGDLNVQEDFAETCALYAKAINGYIDIDKIKEEYPARFKIMSALYDLNDAINGNPNSISFDRKVEIMSIFDDVMGDDTSIIETLLGQDFIERYRNYSPTVKLSFARKMISSGVCKQFYKLFVNKDYFHDFDNDQLLQFYNLYSNNDLQRDILKLEPSITNDVIGT